MTQPADTAAVVLAEAKSSKTEWKVKASAIGTYFAALAASTFLSVTGTEYVHALPDWLETIVYPALVAGVSLLSGRAAKTRPEELSPSTIDAVTKWLTEHMPRRPLR